jgi:signal peptide peptidase SppA
MLQTIAAIMATRIAGFRASDDDIQAALTKRDKLPRADGRGGVGVVPVHGVIVPRADLMSDMSGATSAEDITQQLRALMQDDRVNSIVLDINSPGGNVAGMTELAREVMRARTQKPITAVANYTMASAAYWLGAAATEIVASPSAVLGSVGVFTIHDDLSRALEQKGVKRTYISAGDLKTDGNEVEPLSKETRARIQKKIDASYGRMVTDISRGRGVPVDQVRTAFGNGATVDADEALSLGMVDRVATFEDTVGRLASVAPDRSLPLAAAATDLTRATAQEPSPATAQERVTQARWNACIYRTLLELDMPA